MVGNEQQRKRVTEREKTREQQREKAKNTVASGRAKRVTESERVNGRQ